MICEECSTESEYFVDEHTCGWICPHCGRGLVTSYFAPIDMNETRYSITISATADCDVSALKSFSSISGLNYVSAKKALRSGYCFSDIDAKTAYRIIKSLVDSHISYSVVPEFPYDPEKS